MAAAGLMGHLYFHNNDLGEVAKWIIGDNSLFCGVKPSSLSCAGYSSKIYHFSRLAWYYVSFGFVESTYICLWFCFLLTLRQSVRKSRGTQQKRHSLVQWEAHDYPGERGSFSTLSHSEMEAESFIELPFWNKWNKFLSIFLTKLQRERTSWNTFVNSEIFDTLAGGDCRAFSCILTAQMSFHCSLIQNYYFHSEICSIEFPKAVSLTNLIDLCKYCLLLLNLPRHRSSQEKQQHQLFQKMPKNNMRLHSNLCHHGKCDLS